MQIYHLWSCLVVRLLIYVGVGSSKLKKKKKIGKLSFEALLSERCYFVQVSWGIPLCNFDLCVPKKSLGESTQVT